MKRHAWNYDLSTEPDKDTLTNRHLYTSIHIITHLHACIYIYIYTIGSDIYIYIYQRKLGSNTSVLRENRIARLDLDEGWCVCVCQ